MECDMYAYFFLLYSRSMHNIHSYYKKYYAYLVMGHFVYLYRTHIHHLLSY